MEALAPSDGARSAYESEEWRECEILKAEGAQNFVHLNDLETLVFLIHFLLMNDDLRRATNRGPLCQEDGRVGGCLNLQL